MNIAYHEDAVVIRLNADAGEQSVESLARAIATHLLRFCGETREPRVPAAKPGGLAPEKLERVRAHVEAHIAEPLRTEHMAAVVYISPFHFSRLFKRATGESPHGYVTRRRIERAKVMLADLPLPLVHVAAAVGFQTQGHFSEVFRRHTGTTPRRFRLAAHLSAES